MGFLKDLLYGAAVLGILVLLHEWGHFVAAKLCGVRVDVFSVGFGTRIWGVKRGDTDYRLSALPLGGYVRMAGDNPVEERTGAPYEFLSRPRWQRFIIAVAGPLTNIAVTFLIFWGMYSMAGKPIDKALLQPADVVAVPNHTPNLTGIQAGDRIVAVNGVNTTTWEQVYTQLGDVLPGKTLMLSVVRGDQRLDLSAKMPARKTSTSGGIVGYGEVPANLEEIQPGSPAQKAGLKAGDTIVSMNGKPIATWQQMVDDIQWIGGHAIHFVVRRDGRDVALDITPTQSMNPDDGSMDWIIGALRSIKETYERQSVVLAAQDAGSETYYLTRLIGDVMAGLFRGRVSVRDLAGPIGIVQMSGQAAKLGWMTLLHWVAYISLDLGLLNLLPIPILDGGHVLLLAIEGTLRRDLSVAVKERFVQVGLVFLLGLFAFVMYSDILRLVQTH